ncbi:hypothetical protein CMK11_16770, partial [Candidatus Poribacteria bacterium]|nr:hypothetical protein [Candidatus Poribacteria bacterium]
LRLREQEEYTWGIYVHRAISRKQERAQWIHFPKGTNGWNSRFGHLTGITGISPTRPVEAAPFTVGSSTFTAGDSGTGGAASAGVDLRYGLASGMSLNATINPDFGQVEADPAVLNLGVFETFFEERRPFFVEGSSVFRGPSPDIVGIDGPARLFHSRRIGRAPGRFGVPDGFEEMARPRATTILGAAKLSGKTAAGTSYGILDALTADEYADIRRSEDEGSDGETFRVEPRTNFLIGRVQQDVLGDSTVGGMFTTMNGDGFAPAFVASADGEFKWADKAYRVFTRAGVSRTGAIGDRDSGYEAAAYFSKFSGSFGGQVYADARSPEFNANDLGFMSRAGRTQVGGHVYAQIQNPWALARRSGFNLNAWRQANYDGLALEQGVNVNSWHNLKNYWWFNFGINRELAVYDDLATRGGPAMRRPAAVRWWTNVNSDDRKTVAAGVSMMGVRSDGGDNSYHRRSLRVEVKPATNVQVHVSSSYSSEMSFAQWIENLDVDGDGQDDRFVFGELDSDVFDVSLRLNVALTRTLTLQGYVQPFVAVGDYTAFKELARPKSYDFTPVAEAILNASPDFTRRSLRSNVVLRWEYRPGSALFAVWSQNRSESLDLSDPSFRPLHGVRDSFRDDGEDTFLLKLSYWMGV